MRLDDQSDEELVKRFKSGDADAFDALVRRYQDRIYRLAAVTLYDPQLSADVTQEVFVRAYKGLRRFRFRSAPFTWLYRTTKNVCKEFNRIRRTDELKEEPADATMAPEQLVSGLDRASRVRQFVGHLPARQQEVVMLRMFEDLSVRETAHAMGCREGTVKALLHKAVNGLRVSMQRAGFSNE